jgi:RNA polymerase sigma factor (sigma-70 family)
VKIERNKQHLLIGLAKSDSKAVTTIYNEHFNMVQAYVLNNNGTYDDARDVFQEAMVVLFENVQNKDFVLTCQIKTYLYSVARRIWLKKLHQIGKQASFAENIEEIVSIENDVSIHEKQQHEFEMMDIAMNSLGEPCKSLLSAFYLDKKDMNQISLEFGYTNADNAKNQKYKCLMRLKKLFFAHYNIGE